eukprot:TRINITY_DN250_c0_g2_i1.p1 TRINITY_DN250_c0_g2~~TRINITY_DN250_c0_g2_i1.p1  ORF type:complete len:348 (-),score=53.28 TRINITY_DN250_c0_g2_i1:53-1096(-)
MTAAAAALLALALALAPALCAVLGVAPNAASKYAPATGGVFQCLGSKTVVPFSAVNDDYCDCPDGSDEPGTSACRNGKFYCPQAGFEGKQIATSLLNDKFCDCCDGADEFASGVKCENTCDIEREQALREADAKLKTFDEGMQQKQALVAGVKERWGLLQSELDILRTTIMTETNEPALRLARRNAARSSGTDPLREETLRNDRMRLLERMDEFDFGAASCFVMLFGNEYSFNSSSYQYVYRPYDRVAQVSLQDDSVTNMGKFSKWGNKRETMEFGNGDACWMGPARRTSVKMICGATSGPAASVRSVTEPSKCEYEIEVVTPCACGALTRSALQHRVDALGSQACH